MTDILSKLHDASLLSIQFHWSSQSCEVFFSGGPAMSGSFSLLFQDVTELLVPAANPWGSSPSVLEAKELAAGRYEFTMQSGDIISVVAPNYSFKPTAGI